MAAGSYFARRSNTARRPSMTAKPAPIRPIPREVPGLEVLTQKARTQQNGGNRDQPCLQQQICRARDGEDPKVQNIGHGCR